MMRKEVLAIKQLIVITIKRKHFLSGLFLAFALGALLFYRGNDRKYEANSNVWQNTYSHVFIDGTKEFKVIALTFDDGPHPRFTPQILDILEEFNAKATFFLLGKHVKHYANVVNQIVEAGHEIGNHTYSHIDITRSSYEKIKKEFEDTQAIIYEASGVIPKIFRPPYGFLNNSIAEITYEAGCKIILWTPNQDPMDWNSPGKEVIVKHILNHIDNGNIILLHDYVIEQNNQTIEALRSLLPELTKQGYRFVTVSELIELSELSRQED